MMKHIFGTLLMSVACVSMADVYVHNNTDWLNAYVNYMYWNNVEQRWEEGTQVIPHGEAQRLGGENQTQISNVSYSMAATRIPEWGRKLRKIEDAELTCPQGYDAHIYITPEEEPGIIYTGYRHSYNVHCLEQPQEEAIMPETLQASRRLNDILRQSDNDVKAIIKSYMNLAKGNLDQVSLQVSPEVSDEEKELAIEHIHNATKVESDATLLQHVIYILRGWMTHQQLVNGETPQTQVDHKQAIHDLIWFYFANAVHRGQAFIDGSFFVYDTENFTIFRYLHDHEDSYSRTSSHLRKFYEFTGRTFQHYGLDFEEGHLPVNKKTLLFGKVQSSPKITFIKPETAGTQSYTDAVQHGGEFMASLARKTAPSVFGSDDAPYYRKERIPQDLLSEFKSLVDKMIEPIQEEIKGGASLAYRHRKILHYREWKKAAEALGIRFMYDKTQELKGITKNEPENHQRAKNLLDKMEFYDYKDTRIGREVHIPQEMPQTVSEDIKNLVKTLSQS